MQLTATEATCPLCKQPVSGSGAYPDPTRLCEDCKRIIQTIRSSGNARVASMDQARPIPQPQIAIPVPEIHEKSPCLAEVASNEFEEPATVYASAPVSFNASDDAEADLLDFDELFDDEPIRNAHETLPYLSESYREDYSRGSNAISEPVLEPASEPPALSLANFELAVAETKLETEVPNQTDEIATPDFQIDPMIGDQPSIDSVSNEFVADPLDGPIEGWNFVPSDYPILINAPESNRLERFRLPLVAGILICLGVAGYFLIYRSSIQASQREETAQIQPGQTKHASADQSFASQASLAGAPAKAVITTANADSARAASENSKGSYSLQAAAFPNEAGANEFCERLKRAGVPAYVVSAEIAGRGKWFRVRVGKFETTQQADKFASEARLRARASGLNLQLIVSAYDKP